jgi:hypothetical protein
MTDREVILAPVPAVHLASALTVPALSERVAFGSSSSSWSTLPIGLEVFIYVSGPPHGLYKGFVATWHGKLSGRTAAVSHGPESGMHPDASLRPPTAEASDTAFLGFFEVDKLRALAKPIPLKQFKSASLSGLGVPEWPMVSWLMSI